MFRTTSRARTRLWALSSLALAAASILAGCAPGMASGPNQPLPDGGTHPVSGGQAPVAPVVTLPAPSSDRDRTRGVTGAPGQAPGPIPTTPVPTLPLTAPQAAGSAAARLASLQIALEPLAPEFDQPLYVTHAADGSGRLFVVGKAGQIWIVKDGQTLAEAFLDIRDRVGSSGSEQGLLGLAFPPDFGRRRFFFVNYTDKRGDTVIARFSLAQDADRADAASEFRILGLDQPAANHNGGMLAFGRDGYLYVGVGDGGGAGDTYRNGQNPHSLFAKILRLDVTGDPAQPYRVPDDNPWVGKDWHGQAMVGEAWEIGLRNPWRFSFDRQTGDLWIADVGQNQYEEVDRAPGDQGGLNFGWPIMEGMHCYPTGGSCASEGLVLPVAEYTHAEGGCSITGGYVYRGRQFPALNGVYLYGDYCSGKIWGLAGDAFGQGGWSSRLLLGSDLGLSSFGEDEAGEVYVTDLSGGKVYRVTAR